MGAVGWLVDGAVAGLGGLPSSPPSMLVLREAMAEHVDDCLRFVAGGLEDGWLSEDAAAATSGCAQVSELYRHYQLSWCADEGIRFPAGRKQFSAKVGRRYPVKKSNGYRFTGLVWRRP